MPALLPLLALLLALITGCDRVPSGGHEHGTSTALDASATRYTCGMHPQVVQEGPGTCPICGMDLTPMSRGGSGGGVTIDPTTQQNMNLRTGIVRRQPIFRHLRTIGQVEVGEDQISVVNLRFGGWAERVYADRTGDAVRKGQALFEIYSPDLVAAQEEFLLALRSSGPDSPITRSARRKLELWDIPGGDIDRIASEGEARKTLPIRAPASGFVLHKSVVEGASVKMGEDLYRIGNLDKIWVTAEIYEFDAPWVEVGQPAQMELAFQQGKVLEGTVSYIYPTLNDKTRTLTVRLEFENPGIRLKPGMFATVYIQYRRLEGALAVPSEAVLHTGKRKVVFVDLDGGRFEPREITTGLVGDRHLTEVLDGLEEGERVVVSGQFLLDSESNLQEALDKLAAPGGGEGDTPPHSVYACPMHPEELSAHPSTCTQCGMDLVERPATRDELEAVYGVHPGQAVAPAAHDHGAPGTYQCPMRCEPAQDEPGRCGVCGMFLELIEADAP